MTLVRRNNSLPVPLAIAFSLAALALLLRMMVPAGFMPATTVLELSLCLPGKAQHAWLNTLDLNNASTSIEAAHGHPVLAVEIPHAPDAASTECPVCMLLAQPYYPPADTLGINPAQYAATVAFTAQPCTAPTVATAGPPVGSRAPPMV